MSTMNLIVILVISAIVLVVTAPKPNVLTFGSIITAFISGMALWIRMF